MDVQKLCQSILSNIGGAKNVKSVTHCATRLRLTLNDEEKIQQESINDLDGVMGSIVTGGQYQIIIGQSVGTVYAHFTQLLSTESESDLSHQEMAEPSKPSKKGIIPQVLDTITGIFTPLLPAITAAAMIKTVLVLLDLFHLIDPTGGTYQILTFAGDTAFYFMPVLVAYSASIKFRLNPYLGTIIGMLLLHPTFVSLVSEGKPLKMFGFLPITLANYSSTVIPIILIIWVASYVDRYVERFCPESVKFFLRPLVTFFIMIPLALGIIGPLGSWVGQGLGIVLNLVQNYAVWVLPFIFGALSPVFIMTGMHYAVTIPLVLQSISSNGFDMLGIGFLVSNFAQAGAAIAVGRFAKSQKVRGLAFSSGFTALLGITEPALYGVNLKYKKPFLAVIIAGAMSGLLAGFLNVKRMTFAPTGITTLPIFIDPTNQWNFIFAIVCAVTSFILAFIITSGLVYKDQYLRNELEEK